MGEWDEHSTSLRDTHEQLLCQAAFGVCVTSLKKIQVSSFCCFSRHFYFGIEWGGGSVA